MTRLVARLAGLMASALVAVSCAPSAPLLKPTSTLDANKGIVFGRLAVDRNGERVVTDIHRNLLKPTVTLHVSPFEGVDKLNTNAWAPGKWTVDASLLEGGDFAIVLPAGSYYIVEFDYLDMYPSPAGGLLAARSYVSEGAMWTTRVKSIFRFDVRPGQSTYVGTVLSRFEGGTAGGITWDITVEDDQASSTAWFRKKFPALPEPGKALMVKTPY